MFRKRALQMKFVKDEKEEPRTPTAKDRHERNENLIGMQVIVDNVVTNTAVVVVAAYSAVRVVDTICKIAVVVAKAKVQ